MNRKHLFLLFVVALAVRLLYGCMIREFSVTPDGAGYHTIAVNLLQGHGFSLDGSAPTPARAPLYPLFLFSLYSLFGTGTIVVMIAQAMLDALTCLLTYGIAARTFGTRTALFAAGAYAVYPIMIDYANTLLTETLFTFLLSLSVFLLILALEKHHAGYAAAAGAVCGAATLTRGTTLLLPLFLLLAFLWKRDNVRHWLPYMLCCFLFIAPWSIRNYAQFKQAIPVCSTGAGLGVYISGYESSGLGSYEDALASGRALAGRFGSDSIGYEKFLTSGGLAMLRQHPAAYALLAVKRFPRFWLTSHSGIYGIEKSVREYRQENNYQALAVRFGLLAMQGLFLVLATAGILYSLREGVATAPLVLLLVIIYFSGHVALDPCPRYQLPAMPYVFMFGAYAVTKMNEYRKTIHG